MKKVLSIVIVVAIVAALAAAITSCDSTTKYKVGIVQLVTHDALDAATNGFKQALIDKLGANSVEFIVQNAAGDSAQCATIVNGFVTSNVDLIMANATPALQAAANATTTIPVLGTSVTDYASALGLKDFNGTVGGNVSGTSDLAPLKDQAAMVIELCPNAKTVGIIYCSAESNSKYQADIVAVELKAQGVENVKIYTFADTNDVQTVVTKAANECDALYIPTDNTCASCTETINAITEPQKIPVICGEEAICKGCGVATLSISYYNLGYKTGEMAAKILQGTSKVSEMPIEYDAAPVKKYLASRCTTIGLTVPSSYTAIEE
ncbi:MAG: ABC transporter substrate-binding protein [Clostridiales bacterium]|nr:ABC transporter substrate-binding protein [Clostridiales bacterium]